MTYTPNNSALRPRISTAVIAAMRTPDDRLAALCQNVDALYSALTGIRTNQGTTAFLSSKGGTLGGPLDMGSHGIHGLADPSSGQDAATMHYVDTEVAALNPMTASGDMIYGGTGGAPERLEGDRSGSRRFLRSRSSGGVATPPAWDALAEGDIPSLPASRISDFDGQVRASRLDQMAVPSASVAMGSQRLTGLADPSAAQDAATRAYVDARAPAGTVALMAGAVPAGWLPCDGSAVSRAAFADLFACIGETYGAGDGSTTFNVPALPPYSSVPFAIRA